NILRDGYTTIQDFETSSLIFLEQSGKIFIPRAPLVLISILADYLKLFDIFNGSLMKPFNFHFRTGSSITIRDICGGCVHLSQFVRQNGNPNQEPLHIALREIANAFRDATIGVAAAACPGFKRNEFGM
ncbi:25659_t:CDS:2, partial [Gigaspora rosea]